MDGYWKKWFIEERAGTNSSFLSKDIYFKGKRKRIRITCEGNPKEQSDIEHIISSHLNEVVKKAENARMALVSDYYFLQYIQIEAMEYFEKITTTVQIFLDFLPVHEQEIYKKQFGMRYIHGTTSIEGNTLSLQQVSDLLELQLTPHAKSKREVFEVSNFEKVLEYRNTSKGKVTLAFIKKLHELAMRETGEADPGVFRQNDNTFIIGYDFSVCPSILIEEQLQHIIDDYYAKASSNYHPFELAVLFHLHFEMIHPFSDGNGRVGREIFNYMITKEGYPPMLFLGEERERYISALKHGNAERYEDMVRILMGMYLGLYLSALKKSQFPVRNGEL